MDEFMRRQLWSGFQNIVVLLPSGNQGLFQVAHHSLESHKCSDIRSMTGFLDGYKSSHD